MDDADGVFRLAHLKSAQLNNPASVHQTKEAFEWRTLHLRKAKLKEAKGASYILAAFSMSTMTELQVDVDTTCPVWLFTLFAVNTVTLIAVHIFSLVISTCLLPSMEAVAKEYEAPGPGARRVRAVPDFSPHDRLRGFVHLSVALSNVVGLFLFLFEVALLAWVKFWDHARAACWAGSLVMAPALVLFVAFCWHFNRVLGEVAYRARDQEIRDMQVELSAAEHRHQGTVTFAMDVEVVSYRPGK